MLSIQITATLTCIAGSAPQGRHVRTLSAHTHIQSSEDHLQAEIENTKLLASSVMLSPWYMCAHMKLMWSYCSEVCSAFVPSLLCSCFLQVILMQKTLLDQYCI